MISNSTRQLLDVRRSKEMTRADQITKNRRADRIVYDNVTIHFTVYDNIKIPKWLT